MSHGDDSRTTRSHGAALDKFEDDELRLLHTSLATAEQPKQFLQELATAMSEIVRLKMKDRGIVTWFGSEIGKKLW